MTTHQVGCALSVIWTGSLAVSGQLRVDYLNGLCLPVTPPPLRAGRSLKPFQPGPPQVTPLSDDRGEKRERRRATEKCKERGQRLR